MARARRFTSIRAAALASAALALAALAVALPSACRISRGRPGSAAFIDPAFAAAVPESSRVLSSVARTVAILPDTGASEALYSKLAELEPTLIFISPLLASEAAGIASAYPAAFVATFGWREPPPSRLGVPRLAEAVFRRADAAAAAGLSIAARKAARAGSPPKSSPGTVVAVFAGGDRNELEGAAAAFIGALASAGAEAPIVEITPEPFSEDAAKRLASLDAGFAYVSAPPDAAASWLSAAVAPSCAAWVEYALPPSGAFGAADAFVAWDLGGTVSDLSDAASAGRAGVIGGKWTITFPERGGAPGLKAFWPFPRSK